MATDSSSLIMPNKPLIRSKPVPNITELPPLGMGRSDLIEDFRRHFTRTLGRDKYSKSVHYVYSALAITLRDRLMERWQRTRYAYQETDCKHTYYLALEFLMGRALGNAMLNLGVTDETERAMM